MRIATQAITTVKLLSQESNYSKMKKILFAAQPHKQLNHTKKTIRLYPLRVSIRYIAFSDCFIRKMQHRLELAFDIAVIGFYIYIYIHINK